jgi:hypothetical protein
MNMFSVGKITKYCLKLPIFVNAGNFVNVLEKELLQIRKDKPEFQISLSKLNY